MDRRERSGELLAALLAMQESWQAQVWTALPGIIQSFDPVKKTCVVQPAIMAQVMAEDGGKKWVQLPLLLDCPVQFAGGGGYTLTFPLQLGDECLVIFSSRCLDGWWQSGGIQAQVELRMHDLSDGFCIPGISSVPSVPANISINEVQLRSSDSELMVRVDNSPGAWEVEMKSRASSVKLSTGRVDITGTLYINGAEYLLHEHTGVMSGGADTGGVA